MPVTESLYQDFGGLELPVNVADFSTTLTPLDPARAVLAGLFEAAINSEFGEVWRKVTATLPADHPLVGTDPVETVLQLMPSVAVVNQIKPKWPLLCVHRFGQGTFEQITLDDDRLTQQWQIHYVLGPLDAADQHKLGDICGAVSKLIRLVVRQRGHLSYESGAVQFFPGKGDLSSVKVTSQEGPAQAVFAGDENGAMHYAITLTLETTETTSDDNDVYGVVDGASLSVAVGGGEGLLPGVIYADTDVPLQRG